MPDPKHEITPIPVTLIEKRQASIVNSILYLGTAISGIIALAIIATVLFLSLEGRTIPDILSNWGGIILGFYFGTLSGFIKDVLQSSSTSRD